MSTRADALGGNPYTANPYEPEEDTKRDKNEVDVRRWILWPMLLMHLFGLGTLLFFAVTFAFFAETTPQYFWPAFIVGVTGIPFAFASNVKKMIDAVNMS